MVTPYDEKIMAAFQRGEIAPGRVYLNVVSHDDWCPLLAGTGPCCCDPDIELTDVTDEPQT